MDISGNGDCLAFEELSFQPTEIFQDAQAVSPRPSEGFLDDKDALMEDWQKVGSGMAEAMNEFRQSIGSQPC
jgi:hypothetical protein